MEMKAKIVGVEEAHGGVVVVVQQEKMKIPVAEFESDDEAIVAKKIARSFKAIGFNIDMMRPCDDRGFRTGFWMELEEYEALGRPTIGDVLVMSFKVEK